MLRRRAPTNLLLQISVVLVAMILGLSVTDRSGFERVDLINPTNILRAVAILAMAVTTLWFIVSRRIFFMDVPCMVLTIFYLYQLVPIAVNWGDYGFAAHARQIYSVFEWLVIVWTCSAIINVGNHRSFLYSAYLLRQFLKMLPLVTIGFLILILPFNPSLIFFDTLTTFGGYAIHPNKLSVLCALGVLGWLDDRNAKHAIVISLFLVAVATMTGSRSGTGASILAFGYGMIGRLPANLRIMVYALLVPGVVALVISAFQGDNTLTFSSTGSRSLTDLNSRNFIWESAQRMYTLRPYFGWGWFEGPARLGDFVNKSWFNARNAQNDFLNIQVASGIFATIFLALIYLRNFLVGIKTESAMVTRLVLGTIVVVFLSSLVEPILSTRANSVGMIFILLSLVAGRHSLLLGSQEPRRLRAQAGRPVPVPRVMAR